MVRRETLGLADMREQREKVPRATAFIEPGHANARRETALLRAGFAGRTSLGCTLRGAGASLFAPAPCFFGLGPRPKGCAHTRLFETPSPYITGVQVLSSPTTLRE